MKNSYRNERDREQQNQRSRASDASPRPHRNAIYRASPIEDVRATRPGSLQARKYVGQSHRQSWLGEAQIQCKKLGHLRADWDAYGAEAPNAKARYWTGEALIAMSRLGLPMPRIAPSVENGIGLTLRQGSKSATIEFFNDGDIVAVRSDGVEMPVAWDIIAETKSIEAALDQMRTFVYG